jgi:hypothetical protein
MSGDGNPGEHSVTTEQVPLTPAMNAYLEVVATSAARSGRMVVVLLVAASVVLAVLTGFFALEHFVLTYTLFMWAFFLVVGGAAALGLLRGARHERSDLAAAVFNRATGRFSTKVYSSKGVTYVDVIVGGRRLNSVHAPALESIGSAVGSVDYLSVSGVLLEVRDESGSVLCSKFGPRPGQQVVQSAAR